MDYEKERNLDQLTGEASSWGANPSLNLDPEHDSREIGNKARQAIFSPDSAPDSTLDQTPGPTTAETIEIIDVEPTEAQTETNQDHPPVFRDSDIASNGDKISPETISAAHSIEREMGYNPASAFSDYQRARDLYSKQEKTT